MKDTAVRLKSARGARWEQKAPNRSSALYRKRPI
jgi:hypothetical protein